LAFLSGLKLDDSPKPAALHHLILMPKMVRKRIFDVDFEGDKSFVILIGFREYPLILTWFREKGKGLLKLLHGAHKKHLNS